MIDDSIPEIIIDEDSTGTSRSGEPIESKHNFDADFSDEKLQPEVGLLVEMFCPFDNA